MKKIDNDLKSCLTSVLFYLIGLSAILFCFFALGVWQEKHPTEFCDNLEQEYISEHNTKTCKLRYPILNFKEIKELKEQNKKLEDKNFDLEDKLDSIEYSLKRLESTITDIKAELKND